MYVLVLILGYSYGYIFTWWVALAPTVIPKWRTDPWLRRAHAPPAPRVAIENPGTPNPTPTPSPHPTSRQ